MLSQTTPVNAFEPQSSTLIHTLFDLGDCFGHLCRLPLENALTLFRSASDTALKRPAADTLHSAEYLLPHQLRTNIPFAVSREWQNRVCRYHTSLPTSSGRQDPTPLHHHLNARSLSAIPAEPKQEQRSWLYFTGPLEQLTQLNWQLLSPYEQQHYRLQHLQHWLENKLEQGSLIGHLLLTPLTDLPFGDGLNLNPASSFARVGKQSLPGRQRLPALHFAILRGGRLTEGYGLPPRQLFSVQKQLSDEILAPDDQALLILDADQCLRIRHQLDQALNPA